MATPKGKVIGPNEAQFMCRLSNLHVFDPHPNPNRDNALEFSCTGLIPKKGNQFCADPLSEYNLVKGVIDQVALQKFGSDFKLQKQPLKNGDKELNDSGKPKNPGCMYLSMRSNISNGVPEQPLLIDGDGHYLAKGAAKSGDWGLVRLRVWPFDNKSGKGVSVTLVSIQFIYQDEALGTFVDAATIINDYGKVDGAHKFGSAGSGSQPPAHVGKVRLEDELDDPFDDGQGDDEGFSS